LSVFPPKSRFRRRKNRCYELAFRTLHDLAEADRATGVILVHGTVALDSVVIGHAWLESDGEAYDAADHVTMPVAEYVAERGAVAERRYAFKEASVEMLTKNHYGPWHEGAVSNTHKAVMMTTHGGAKIAVDVKIAPLIRRIWDFGIATVQSCQEIEPGTAYIAFPNIAAARKFIRMGRPRERARDRYYYKPVVIGDRLSLAQLKAMGQEYMHAHCTVPFPAKDIPHLFKAFRSAERRPGSHP